MHQQLQLHDLELLLRLSVLEQQHQRQFGHRHHDHLRMPHDVRHKKTCTRTAKPVTTTTGAPYTHTWGEERSQHLTGCVMDRNQDYDTKNTTPDGTAAKKYPAENSANCVPSTLGTLGYNWTGLNDQVDDMSAGGSTNQTIGLAWAGRPSRKACP